MNFETALKLLKAGHKIRLPLWDDESTFLVIKYPNKKYPGHNGEIVIAHTFGSWWTWEPKSDEILSNNWVCMDIDAFYDIGHSEGFKEGYDHALERYLEFLNSRDKISATKDYVQLIEDLQSK